MAKPFYCALALMALSGCPTPQCPEGSSMLEGRCVAVDGAVNADAGGDASLIADVFMPPDAFVEPDAFSPDACALTTWFRDRDEDSFGNAADSVTGCVAPAGYVLADGDCNDASPAAHPGVAELCNRADDDCDGASDEGLTHIIGEPVVIPTETFGTDVARGQVGILPYSAGHMLLWSQAASGMNLIVSSALNRDNTTTVAPHTVLDGYPLTLRALTADEAVLVYQPTLDSSQLLARRLSTVLGNATLVSDAVVIEDAPQCCRVVTTTVTRERVVFTWRTEASLQTYARSCTRDLTDCSPRVTLFTENAFLAGMAGDGPNPIAFYAATLAGDVGLHAYADRLDATTLAFENRPLRVNAGTAQDFPIATANSLLVGTAAVIVVGESGTREFIRVAAGALGEELRILSRTPLPPMLESGLTALERNRGGFEFVSGSASVAGSMRDRVSWESFTSAGTATAPVTWSGPQPTSIAVAEGGFLRTEDGPPRLVFQRTGCE